jgi:ABC-type molybdate transport system substrate-binding protein
MKLAASSLLDPTEQLAKKFKVRIPIEVVVDAKF